ncbi:MAG: bifunctional (p)ppGpp synthetase/guanosine-3',5'-bis(diphosphate) 3'-pyrophosphohydrolase, partial [Bacteroidia bacterium]
MLENPNQDPIEFLDDFKMNLFSSEIMVFTPKGNIITLPKGATALDFAYEIHTEIGNKAIGSKVNYKLQPLNAVLQSGDQVEIITSEKSKPSREWLDYVTLAKAKSSIKHSLRADSRYLVEKGRDILLQKLESLKLDSGEENINRLMAHFESISTDELYTKISSGAFSIDNLKKVLKKGSSNRLVKYWELKIASSTRHPEAKVMTTTTIDKKVPFLLRENIDDQKESYEIARCCNPIPGDEVVGYLSNANKLVIHKPKCPVAIRLMSSEGNNLIAVKWTIHKMVSFLARIRINGIDRIGIVSDITKIISDELNVNMSNVNVSVHEGIFEGSLDLFVHHTKDLNNLIMKLVNIKGVESVKRIEDF